MEARKLESAARRHAIALARDLVDHIRRSLTAELHGSFDGVESSAPSRRPCGGVSRAVSGAAPRPVRESDVPPSLAAYERMAILRALHESGHDAIEAARQLRTSKSSLYRRMAKLGIPRRPLGQRGGVPAVADGYLRLPGRVSFEAYERRALQRALEQAGGNMEVAARLLGIGKSTLYRRCSARAVR